MPVAAGVPYGLCSSLRPCSLQRLKARRKTGEKCALSDLLVGRVFDNSQMLSDVMAVCGFARILGNKNHAQTVSKNTGNFFGGSEGRLFRWLSSVCES